MLWCLSVGARSLVIWDSHVSGGRPTGRLCGVRWYWRAFCAGVSGCSLKMWPKRFSLLFLSFSLMGVSCVSLYSFLLLIVFGYL